MNKKDRLTGFIAFLVIITTPFALGAFLLLVLTQGVLKEMDPAESGYAAATWWVIGFSVVYFIVTMNNQ